MERTMTTPGKSLGAIRRKAVDLASFNPIRESQIAPDMPLPLVMEPAADQVDLGVAGSSRLRPAAPTWAKTRRLRGLGHGVKDDVLTTRASRSTGRPAIDPRGAHAVDEAAVLTRVTVQYCPP